MLEIKKGKSSKSYENEFFRKFSSNLSNLFDENKWDGLLLGMPECIKKEDLQIDALLVTDSRIIIIDFKNYEGDLILPNSREFKFGRWLIGDSITVRGGSSSNPFGQLGKQRNKLVDELKYLLPDFDKNSTYTLVCFQNEIRIIGEIPGEYEVTFAITDSNNYVNKIFDILDVNDPKRNYLDEDIKTVFTKKVFYSKDYNPRTHLISPKEPTMSVEKTEEIDESIIHKLSNFLNSKSKILTLFGTTRNGKTSLISQIRDLGFDNNFTDVPVFAYSSRLRNNMLKRNPELEDVESLYGTIFDFENEEIDKNYKKTFNLKTREEDKESGKTLYIIDDSQLITNSYRDEEFLKFGSGYLLKDILDYLDLKGKDDSKIIFIGDKNKLSYGSQAEYALNTSYLKALLDDEEIYSEITEIELADAKSNSEIVKTCQNIAKNLKDNKFNNLIINDKADVSLIDKSSYEGILEETYDNPYGSKVLVYTNEQSNQINHWIKRNIAKGNNEINVGDFVVINSSILSYPPSRIELADNPFDLTDQPFDFVEPKRINAGTFGEIIFVDRKNTLVKKAEIRNAIEIKLSFIPCQIKLQDGVNVEALIFENYLNSKNGKLDINEVIALTSILSKLEKKALDKQPFKNSTEYENMIKADDYVYKNGGYRDKKDNRKLTKYERNYRKRVISQLNVKDNEYFKLLNAAKVKYAWCMTVNKSMAYMFDRVYFNTNQGENRGKTNSEYYKWLYTGISIGESHVSLLNWKPISPFLNAKFNSELPSNIPKAKNILMKFSDINECSDSEIKSFILNSLNDLEVSVTNIIARNYLKIVTINSLDEKVELFFDYNGSGEVKLPRLKGGSEKLFNKISEVFNKNDNPKDVYYNFDEMKDVFLELTELLIKNHIKTKVNLSHEWETIFQFSKLEDQVKVQVWNSAKGIVSQINILEGSKDLFKEIEALIKVTYKID